MKLRKYLTCLNVLRRDLWIKYKHKQTTNSKNCILLQGTQIRHIRILGWTYYVRPTHCDSRKVQRTLPLPKQWGNHSLGEPWHPWRALLWELLKGRWELLPSNWGPWIQWECWNFRVTWTKKQHLMIRDLVGMVIIIGSKLSSSQNSLLT